ncbi:MAG: hypothetical protein JRC99_00160 [Deltaproteobacteria bacterium]|nr:hypothetical protein [Deltaproteobacteria bacterium]
MKSLLLLLLSLLLTTGCASEQYYQTQPARDQAEGERVAKAAAGFIGIAQAAFAPNQQITDPVAPVVQQANQQALPPCESCGGTEASSGAVVHLSYDDEGMAVPGRVEFTDAANPDAICSAEAPCIEGGKAPDVGSGKAVFPETIPGQAQMTTPVPEVQERGGGESLLLQYIFAEKQAESQRQIAVEKTKQLQALVAGYTQAILKEQSAQAAPFDPTALGLEAIKQTPLGLAIWGLQSLGKAGIAGAAGNTTATLTNGSALSQDGANSGSGYAPVTKITKISGVEE